jgi:hypothetical protein
MGNITVSESWWNLGDESNKDKEMGESTNTTILLWFDLLCLMPLSAIFQLYHGDQFYWLKKLESPERTTDHGQATGKLYHLRLQVECTLFCNLQSRMWTHAVLVIGLYELLGNPTTLLIEPPGPSNTTMKFVPIEKFIRICRVLYCDSTKSNITIRQKKKICVLTVTRPIASDPMNFYTEFG